MTKLYRVVSYVIGLNGYGPSKEIIKQEIEANKYPEFHRVRDIQVTDIGE